MDRFTFKPLAPDQKEKIKQQAKKEKVDKAKLLDKTLRKQGSRLPDDSDLFIHYMDENGRWVNKP